MTHVFFLPESHQASVQGPGIDSGALPFKPRVGVGYSHSHPKDSAMLGVGLGFVVFSPAGSDDDGHT